MSQEIINEINNARRLIEDLHNDLGDNTSIWEVEVLVEEDRLISSIFNNYCKLAIALGIVKFTGKSKKRFILIEDDITNEKNYKKAIKYISNNVVDKDFKYWWMKKYENMKSMNFEDTLCVKNY